MSKRTIAIVGIAAGALAVLLLYALIVSGILDERRQQAALADQAAPLDTALAEQGEGALVLLTRQAELATLQAELLEAQFAFPSEVDSTEVLAHIVTASALYNVNLRQIQARNPVTAALEASTYRIFAYDVEVEGALENISAFLTGLESGPIGTLLLDQVRLEEIPSPTPPPTPAPAAAPAGDHVLYRATLVIEVFVRLAEPGTTPLPSVHTPVSPEEQISQLKELLGQARQEEDWERAISILLALRQIAPPDPMLDALLVEAYVRDGQRRLAAGQYDQAGADFRAALALQPESAEALAGMAAVVALTPTPTPTPTATPTDTPTPTPTITPTVTPTPLPYYVSQISFGPNNRYPDLECDWFGFVGKVTDYGGYPIEGVRVHVWAYLWEGVWTKTLASGDYEQYLFPGPRLEIWYIQLFDGETAVSEAVRVDSEPDCNKTVITVNWQRRY